MNDLSHEARALIDAARGADDPTPGDRARVHGAISAAVAAGTGAAVVGATATASAATQTTATAVATKAAAVTTWTATSTKIVTALVVAGTVGGAVAMSPALRSSEPAEPPAMVAPRVDAPERRARTLPAANQAALRDEEPAESPAPVVATPIDAEQRRTPTPAEAEIPREEPAAADPLLDELSLLRRASEASRRGEPQTALRLLRRHRRQFPAGELVAERQAATVFALCDVGRGDEARRAASRFVREHPTSPLLEGVRRACAADSANSPTR